MGHRFARSDKHWPHGNNQETFSSIVWDRWTLRNLYTAGGDGGFFWDLTNKSGEASPSIVEDCVGTGRAFGGGVCLSRSCVRTSRACFGAATSSPSTGSATRRPSWWADGRRRCPSIPHVVFEDCTLVHPDNAVAMSYASHCARAKFVDCRMIVLNFTQPEMGGKSTGIICTQGHAPTGRLHVDLEDCILAGYSVFTPGEARKAVTYTTKGKARPTCSSSRMCPRASSGWGSGPRTCSPGSLRHGLSLCHRRVPCGPS